MSTSEEFIPYQKRDQTEQEMLERSSSYYRLMNERRSIRMFSDRDVPFEVIEYIVKTAGTAPSGAHKQPWTFCIVRSTDLKAKIRQAAEEEEYKSYNGRMSETWLKDLEPFGTNWQKPFLETVPWIIVVFKRAYELEEGNKHQNYFVNESVGIACGMLISAIHHVGLATLTHTPSPMNFLTQLLERPENERPYLLLPVGYPADDAKVPDLARKGFDEIAVVYD